MSGFLFVLVVFLFQSSGPTDPGDLFQVEELAPGVHLFRPAGKNDVSRTNSLVVDRDDGLLIIGAQPAPAAARDLLAAVAKLSTKQVRYLVYPHSHAEAAGGAAAFPDSTLVIGSAGCLLAMEDEEYDFGSESRVRAGDPASWTEPPRRMPTMVPTARTVLTDSRNTVELLPFQSSHSSGDMAVYLPDSDVFFAGAVLFPDGSPYGADANTSIWIAALNHLIRQGPRVSVPMRGPVQDTASLRKQRDSLAWLRATIGEGLMDRLPIEEIRERVLESEDLEQRFDMSSPFWPGLVEESTRQAWDRRKKLLPGGG